MAFMKKADIYYQAMKARDHRFDGKFFVGVKTTGIYCRPICPAQPKKENVEFFASHLEAEKAGYRPCMRCRPEAAPRSPAWIGTSAIVQRAIKVLHSSEILSFGENEFAQKFGVSARHLRRLFKEEVGKTPKQLIDEHRLSIARELLTESDLSVAQIAFASGFSSVRRFNDAFKDKFKTSPRRVRKKGDLNKGVVRLALAYRPPYDFEGLLSSYYNHRVGELESFTQDTMTRVIRSHNKVGTVTLRNESEKSRLLVEIKHPDISVIYSVVSRIRSMFDLDSDPILIANSLEQSRDLKRLLKLTPGIRLPSGWDPFELAVATILGQFVSVESGRKLVAQLIDIAGVEVARAAESKIKFFPSPQQLVEADLSTLKTTGARKQTLKDFSAAIVQKKISLESAQDVQDFIKNVREIKGIGLWTAQYMALKILKHTDSFPETDLILKRELERYKDLALDEMSPWKGYVAALLWRHSGLLKSKKLK